MRAALFACILSSMPLGLQHRLKADHHWGPCPDPTWAIVASDAYSIEMASTSGARGDVVGVTVSLRSELPSGLKHGEGFPAIFIVLSHDPELVEIVGTPAYGDELMEMILPGPGGVVFMPVDEDLGIPRHIPGFEPVGHGFYLGVGFKIDAYNARFPSREPLPLITVFYRLKGPPGSVGSFSNSEPGSIQFGNARCTFTQLIISSSQSPPGGTRYVSDLHQLGTLTVLDGPTTRPDPPPSTEAKVYPRAPHTSEANLRIFLDTVDSWPGAHDVPIKVFASADVEYTTLFIGFDFDPKVLRFSRGEQHLTGGVIGTEHPGENPEAFVYLLSGSLANRRVAAEGEMVHAATLFFDVLDVGDQGVQATIKVAESPPPFIGVLHEGDAGPPIRPTAIADGVINIWEAPFARRGDANLDGRFDVSDPVGLLGHLFLGGLSPACRGAADYDLTATLDLTDAVTMLGALFLGADPPGGTSPTEVSCKSL